MYFPEKLTVKWLRNAYSEGLTPYDVAEEILKRAENYKDKNIWITPPSMALMAKYIDALPKDRENCPLWGIPFAIKDNIDLEQVPTTAACPEYSYIPEKNAFVVQKLIDAGAVPIGKTNLDQFATGLVGTRSPYGEVHNSYEDEMISGGSSSGSAVCVALGIAAFALGTDTAGSGRVPAMLNTLVGYKPPLGSWSTGGVVPACASLDCVTVFANNLEEARLVDSFAKGYDKDCDWSRHYECKGDRLPHKIYLPKEEPRFFGDFAETYRSKWNNAVKRIENMGIAVEKIDYEMFSKAALILYEGAYVAERWQDLKDFVENNPGKTFPVTEKILRSGAKAENTAYRLFEDLHTLQKYRHITRELLKGAVMIMPTAGGSFTRDEVREDPVGTNSLMGLYTNHCNLLDLAAIAVPENTADRVKPFGITIFGLCDEENIVCAAAEAFMKTESIKIGVCGLHKKGYALESQLTELGGEFICHSRTSADYKLYILDTTPVKPGLVRSDKGNNIDIDIYSLPKNKLGEFMEKVSMPLNIGAIKLENGEYIKGFLCEAEAVKTAEDITEKGKF